MTTSFPLLGQFVSSFDVDRSPLSSVHFGRILSVQWVSTVTDS